MTATTGKTTTAKTPRRRAAAKKRGAAPDSNASGMFDVTDAAARTSEGVIEHVALDHIDLAPNPRKTISEDGLVRLAMMMMQWGQFVPVIGRRVAPDRVVVYDGQRRYRAAQRSRDLAGGDGFEDLKPLVSLIVLLVDYEPTPADIRRIQAQANHQEDLQLCDQVAQFRDCWLDRAGGREADRIAAVCADLGIGPRKAQNLQRCLTLPDDLIARLAERPTGDELSITMALRLAEMHEVSPGLVGAVAERITSRDLHDRALKDPGAFVHATVIENEKVYAVRIEEGALLDAATELRRARGHLTEEHDATLSQILARAAAAEAADDTTAGGQPAKAPLRKKIDLSAGVERLASRASAVALKIRVDAAMRDRAIAGRFAWVHERGTDFASSVWIIDPLFFVDAVEDLLRDAPEQGAAQESYFKTAGVDDDDMKQAAADADAQRRAERERRQAAADRNVSLGLDITGQLMEPRGEQMKALCALVVRLVAAHFPDVVAFGAGWTNLSHQQAVGDTRRFHPIGTEQIVEAELQRALADDDPLLGIAGFMARFCAAFLLDTDGVTKTKSLGTDRMTRPLRDALPSGSSELRDALWAFMAPMLSPALRERNLPAFVIDDADAAFTVDLDAHRGTGDIADLDLGATDIEQEG